MDTHHVLERSEKQRGQVAGAAAAAEPTAAATSRGPFIVTDDGAHLFYRDWGRGRPVLFAHSGGLNGDMWQYQMLDLVGRGHRSIAYDRRGHGRSSQPDGGYDYDRLADDLASLIEELDLRDVTLVGHSMSGGEIVRYLTRHGSRRVAGIVLIGSTLPFLMRTPDNPEGLDPAMIEAVRAAWRRDFPKWIDDNADPFFVAETSAGMRRWLVRQFDQCSLRAAIACNVATFETDFRAELATIAVPALILHGTLDASVPLGFAQATARLIPDCRIEVYEGAPHGLFLTHMERLNADLAAFLDE